MEKKKIRKEIKDRINRKVGPYDHIVWWGTCSRCGVRRYVFIEEVREIAVKERCPSNDNYIDLIDYKVPCKSRTCVSGIRIRGRVPSFEACHKNDIKRRETTIA